MFRKLVKHEFINTYKMMSLILGIMFLSCILGGITGQLTDNISNEYIFSFYNIMTAFGYSCLLLMPFLAFITLCKNYWNSMYSSRGYLTHTLPVSANELLNAKILTSVLWIIISIIITVLSWLALSFISGELNTTDLKFMLESFGHPIIYRYGIDDIGYYNDFYLYPYLSIDMFFGIIMYLIVIFTSMSLGQTVSNHKNGTSIAYGAGFLILSQIFVVVYYTVIDLYMGKHYQEGMYAHDLIIYRNMLLGLVPIMLLCIVICYFINLKVIKKHLNLQ